MTPVLAEVGKNTKDAAALMTKIFCIGLDSLTRDHEEVIASNGSVIYFKSIDKIVLREDNIPSIILADKTQQKISGFSKFKETFKNIPLIVVSNDHSFKGLSEWLKLKNCHPVFAPTAKELDYEIKRALRNNKILHENTELKNRLEKVAKELFFLQEAIRILTSSLGIKEILNTFMKKAMKIIDIDAWTVFLIDEESGDLVFENSSTKSGVKKSAKKIRLKIGEGFAGWVAKEQTPVVIPDISLDNRFCSEVDKELGCAAKSLICVPIKCKDNLRGVLEIVKKTVSNPFTRDDLDFALKLADHIAIAVEISSLYQKMAEVSVTDDLTKLFNMRYLNRTLEIEIVRANRHQTSLSLIFMDIDYFKAVNDNYGHLTGSKLLVEIGQILIKNLRSVDIVARYGGDEFVIVLPQTAPRYAVQVAERIRKSIEQHVFLKKEGYSLKITASLGVASYPESAKSREELMRLADEAMYRVKYQTRNGVYAIV